MYYIYTYFRFTNVCNFNRVLYFEANISCLKKRRFYTTKVSCYLQSPGMLFVLCSKNNKKICQNQIIKDTSSTEIKNIIIQFCKSLSKSCNY